MTLNHSKTWPVSTFAVVQLRVDPNSRTYSALTDSGLVLTAPEGPKETENHEFKNDNFQHNEQLHETARNQAVDYSDEMEIGCALPLSKKHLEMFSKMSYHRPATTIRTDTVSTTLEQDDLDSEHHNYTSEKTNSIPYKYDNTTNSNSCEKLSTDVESTGVQTKINTIGRRPSNNVENWDLIYKENRVNKFTKVRNESIADDYFNGVAKKIGNEIKSGNCSKHNDCLLSDFPLDARKATTLRRHYYPEGGWGWVIIVCSVLLHTLNHGFQLSCSQLVTSAADKFKTTPLDVAGKLLFLIISDRY